MKRCTRTIKLYNVLFPLWMLLMFPQAWLIVLPGNLVIDSLVLVVAMLALKLSEKRTFYKRHILSIYGFGMLTDVIGAAYMLLLTWKFEVGTMGDEPYLTIPALILSAILIFVFNYFVSFRKDDKKTRWVMSLIFAIVTAPYTFLVPSGWLYH